jgi:hypothetical protein
VPDAIRGLSRINHAPLAKVCHYGSFAAFDKDLGDFSAKFPANIHAGRNTRLPEDMRALAFLPYGYGIKTVMSFLARLVTSFYFVNFP